MRENQNFDSFRHVQLKETNVLQDFLFEYSRTYLNWSSNSGNH